MHLGWRGWLGADPRADPETFRVKAQTEMFCDLGNKVWHKDNKETISMLLNGDQHNDGTLYMVNQIFGPVQRRHSEYVKPDFSSVLIGYIHTPTGYIWRAQNILSMPSAQKLTLDMLKYTTKVMNWNVLYNWQGK